MPPQADTLGGHKHCCGGGMPTARRTGPNTPKEEKTVSAEFVSAEFVGKCLRHTEGRAPLRGHSANDTLQGLQVPRITRHPPPGLCVLSTRASTGSRQHGQMRAAHTDVDRISIARAQLPAGSKHTPTGRPPTRSTPSCVQLRHKYP